MMNREKAIYIFEMYLTIQELIMNAGFPAYCYFSTEFNYMGRIQIYTVNNFEIPETVATINFNYPHSIVLKASYPAYKDQKWKEIKELLLKKFDIVMISLSTFLNPESEVADSVVTEIYEITEKRK